MKMMKTPGALARTAALALAVFSSLAGAPAVAAADPAAGTADAHAAAVPSSEALPEADQILDKWNEARGGREALDRVRTVWSKGRFEIPAMGLVAEIISWVADSGRTRASITSPALGDIEQGGDGTFYWERSSMAGSKLKKGCDLWRARKEAAAGSYTDWKDWYRSVNTHAADTVNGVPAWKVLATPEKCEAETLWFDRSSGLLLKQASIVQTDQGDIPLEIFPLDYREVSGLMLPFRVKQSLMRGLQVMEVTIDTLAINVDLPENVFQPPAEVQELIEKEKAAGSGTGGQSKTP